MMVNAADADTYPNKPVRWIVPYVAGGGSDFLARTVAEEIARQTGRTFLVENRPGGGTSIGAAQAARAKPDGYTLLSADNGTLVFNPALYRSLTYDAKDFAPVTLMGRFPMILVLGPEVDAKNARAFLELAKSSFPRLTYASFGTGGPHHLAMELLLKKAGVDMQHVPYRGGPPAFSDLIGGRIPVLMTDMATGAGFIKAGRVRPVAVAHTERLPQLPDVPTFAEIGFPGVVAAALVGVSVPAGTPQETIERLNQMVVAAVRSPSVQHSLMEYGIQPVGSTAQEWGDLLVSESTEWHALIRELDIRLD